MKLTFNLLDQDECGHVSAVIANMHGMGVMSAPVSEQPAEQPAQTEMNLATQPTVVDDGVALDATGGPVAPTPTPVDAQAGVELDANGTPWIEAVHATTKTQTVKGVWKSKRGVDKDVVAEAEAAARAKISGTPQPVVPTGPVVPDADAPAPVASMADVSQAWTDACSMGVMSADMAAGMYADIGVDPSQLAVNETMRAKMVAHLQSLMARVTTAPIPGV